MLISTLASRLFLPYFYVPSKKQNKTKEKKKTFKVPHHLTTSAKYNFLPFLKALSSPHPPLPQVSYQQHLTLCTIHSFFKHSNLLLSGIHIYFIDCYFPVFFVRSCTQGSKHLRYLVLSQINPLFSLIYPK